jgi:hypothetical protein
MVGGLIQTASGKGGVQGELVTANLLHAATLTDELSRQKLGFPVGNEPANDIATEDVHDHIEIEVTPLDRPFEPSDIPRPHLIRARRQQFWFPIGWTTHLVMPRSHLIIFCQDAVIVRQ